LIHTGTVVWTKPCIPLPLEVRGKGTRGVGGVAGKEAYTVQTIDIISQCGNTLYLAVSHNVFGKHSICIFFLSTCKLVSWFGTGHCTPSFLPLIIQGQVSVES
jgi:hypothetical protein